MKRNFVVVALAAVFALAGCATSNPEAVLYKGYQTSSATVKATTVLVNRDQIKTEDAVDVNVLGITAKQTLDRGKEDLKKCREAEALAKATGGTVVRCEVNANINLGAGVLDQLEKYLQARERGK